MLNWIQRPRLTLSKGVYMFVKILGLMLKDIGMWLVKEVSWRVGIAVLIVVALWAIAVPGVWVTEEVYRHTPVLQDTYAKHDVDFKGYNYEADFRESYASFENFFAYAFFGIFSTLMLVGPPVILIFILCVALFLLYCLGYIIFNGPREVKNFWEKYKKKVK